NSSGDEAVPHWCMPEPTSVCQSCFPSRSNAQTPASPKKAYTFSPSVAGVLEASKGHKSRAAEILGISRPKLDRLIAKHDLKVPKSWAGDAEGP
ncbi:MAG: helix-turn-helix domain-containing protein, partial [Planctomycetes bacterium]|nr:helix-turn-helix domain-containing protein [Planctomycetota bacterium]